MCLSLDEHSAWGSLDDWDTVKDSALALKINDSKAIINKHFGNTNFIYVQLKSSPYFTCGFLPSFKWRILGLGSRAVVSSSKSCFCIAVCSSPFPPSLSALVRKEVGKNLHWVSQCKVDCWQLLLSGLPWIPVHPTHAHISLGTKVCFCRHHESKFSKMVKLNKEFYTRQYSTLLVHTIQ